MDAEIFVGGGRGAGKKPAKSQKSEGYKKLEKSARALAKQSGKSLPHVVDFEIWNLQWNFNFPPFNKPEHKQRILELLPTKVNQAVRFSLVGADCSIANAIRRVMLVELKTRALEFDLASVETNDPEIKLGMLYDRITQIPIDYDTPLDSEFSLEFVNDGPLQGSTRICYSRQIVESGRGGARRFSDTFRLFHLAPEKYLRIPRITVREGRCYEDGPQFSLTSEFQYQVRDFIEVNFLNERGYLVSKMVRRADLVAKLGEKHAAVRGPLESWPVLVVPDSRHLALLTKSELDRYTQGITVIKGDGRLSPDEFLRGWSSAGCSPSEIFMEFTLYGTVNPETAMRDICTDLITRLEALLDEKNLTIQTSDEESQILIKGEDYTLAEMISKRISELDPGISWINYTMDHPSIRIVTFNIIHPQPIQIFTDAVKELMDVFAHLRDEFKGAKVSDHLVSERG
jgi:DNA-directed RNA polymerase subunit L